MAISSVLSTQWPLKNVIRQSEPYGTAQLLTRTLENCSRWRGNQEWPIAQFFCLSSCPPRSFSLSCFVSMCVQVCAQMCIWRPKDNSRHRSSGTICIFVWDRISPWPGTCQVNLASPMSHRCLFLHSQCWDDKQTPPNLDIISTWVPGVRLKSPDLQDKRFIDWALFTVLSDSIICFFNYLEISFNNHSLEYWLYTGVLNFLLSHRDFHHFSLSDEPMIDRCQEKPHTWLPIWGWKAHTYQYETKEEQDG